MNLLDQPALSDISGIQDSQSYSSECTITSQKYMVLKMDEFLDSHHYQPTWKWLNVTVLEEIFPFCIR